MQPEAPQNPRNVRDHLRRALRVIRRHPFMKLAALLLAIVFWVVVIASDPSLLIEKTFTDAVVTVPGAGNAAQPRLYGHAGFGKRGHYGALPRGGHAGQL